MYASLTLLKDYLWISGNDQDVLLTSFLESAEEIINKLCGVDTFDLSTQAELVDLRKVYTNQYGLNIILKNKPVVSIDEIDWVAYNWVLGKDYIIVDQRKAIIKNMAVNDNFGYRRIKYTWGYDRSKTTDTVTVDELPEDIKQMEIMLAWGMYTTKDYQGVTSYKLGDESISFGDLNGETAENIYYSFKKILDKYKSFNLPA